MVHRSRRRVLTLAGAGLTAALAGCQFPGGEGEGEEGGEGGVGGEGGEEGGEGGVGGEGGEEEGQIAPRGEMHLGAEHLAVEDGEGCFDGGWDVVPRE